MKITKKAYENPIKDIYDEDLSWGALGLITYLVFEQYFNIVFKKRNYPKELVDELIKNGYLEM